MYGKSVTGRVPKRNKEMFLRPAAQGRAGHRGSLLSLLICPPWGPLGGREVRSLWGKLSWHDPGWTGACFSSEVSQGRLNSMTGLQASGRSGAGGVGGWGGGTTTRWAGSTFGDCTESHLGRFQCHLSLLCSRYSSAAISYLMEAALNGL